MAYKFGNEPYVVIGTQKWQRRNLDVTTYRNGDVIPYVKDNTAWSSLTTGAWCWYNNDPELGKIYGKLYNWYAINDPRGLAPEGWYIPTESDISILINYLGGSNIAGGKMKDTGLLYWSNPNTGATNSSKFKGLPGGFRKQDGIFQEINLYGSWSVSDSYNNYFLDYETTKFLPDLSSIKEGHSIRCIKD